MSVSPIPVCVVGFGSSARTFHIPFVTSLPELFSLHSIQQRPGSKAGPPAAQHHPDVSIVPSFEECISGPLALPKPGLVVISTANSTHYSFAKQALEAGYHVIVEKPITWRHAEALHLVELAREHGLVCASFNNRRWDCDFLTVKSLLAPPGSDSTQPSPIGTPTYFESRFDRYRPLSKGGWREETGFEQGGGLLLDLGSHLADQLLTLFGPPETITGFVRNQRGQLAPAVDDDFLILAHYPSPTAPLPPSDPAPGTRLSGLRATLGATVLSAHVDGEQPRFRVEGVRGSYEKRGVDPQEDQLKKGWSPSKPPPQDFGLYDETRDPASVRLGRLTTNATAGTPASAGSPPVQPTLTVSDIPTLPGRYEDYWRNVAASITAAESARSNGSGPSAAHEAIEKTLVVKPAEAADCVKFLCLARKSSAEGRTVRWDESV